MQSLKTVRDLENVHEITDLLAPNDPAKLCSGIERKAAGWVVDGDTRLSDSSAGVGKGAKGDHKGSYRATTPCEHHTKGTSVRGDKCRFSHKGSDAKSSGKGSKGKKSRNEGDRCKKCGRITNPRHWARSFPEAVSAQVALTSPPPSLVSETAPPGLPVHANIDVNLENVSALAAILRDVLSPVGSSDSGQAARLATLARSAGYVVRQNFAVRCTQSNQAVVHCCELWWKT